MILNPLTRTPLSQHPIISRFMKAVYYLAHPPPQIWSVSSVSPMLQTWGNPEALTRAKLTWRLAMLLALALARRASDPFILDLKANIHVNILKLCDIGLYHRKSTLSFSTLHWKEISTR